MDHEKTNTDYQKINFDPHFYRFTLPRSLCEIDADLRRAEEQILRQLRKVTA